MMAFFRQLQLLLWKNKLGIIRRPVWSVTLVLWPVIIFIIIAVTRHQFPPVLRSTCYVGPRNLPSTGFFPFLETLMCNTDSDCHNTSRLTHSKQPSRAKRSTTPSDDSSLSTLVRGIGLMQHIDTDKDLAVLLNSLYSFVGSPSRQPAVPHNQTSTGDEEMKNLTETGEMLKSAICTLALPLVQAPSPLITFCKSNNTVLEVVLKTCAQVLSELQPEELAEVAEIIVKIFEQLQNETSLWECLQSLPHIFNPTSPELLLANLEKLLINLQKILIIMDHNFPEIKCVTSSVHPILVAGIRMIEYIQNWPGKTVSIRLGDVMTCNESLWQVFSNIEIPLDKAIFLAIDRNVARDFVCKNSTGLTWLACASESVDMFLGCICPNKLVQQNLLAWSKFVSQHDLIFVKGMLHSLTGLFEGSGMTRTTRSVDTQPQNIEEELFLEVGKVVMEIVQLSHEAEAIVQNFLRVGFHSMKIGTGAMVPVQEIVENVMKDVTTIKMIVLTLMSDQSQTTLWISKALGSVLEMIMTPDPVTCDAILDEFGWVFSIKTIKPEVVRSFLCGNTTTIEQTLLKDWKPLVENAVEIYGVLMGNAKFNVTLPMILSEWHTLFSKSLELQGLLLKIGEDWSGEYWMHWMSENCSANHLPSSLQQSVWPFMVKLGQWFEQSHLWPEAKNYFHMFLWILNSTDTSQPNCHMNMETFGIECDTNFDWDRFSHVLTTLLSPTEEVFISCLKRSVRVLQHVYSGYYKHLAASSLQNDIQGGGPLSDFLINMLNKVDDFARTLTTLPDQSFSNPQVMAALYANLLESIGLKPLLPLIMHNGPVNVSQVLEVVSELGRSNQGIFTFNESDPTMANLEKNIMHFLSMEGNFSFSIHLSMSQSLLTYYSYFSPEEVAKLKQAIQPFTNQTSSGIVEAILSSLELLRTIIDAPSGDPTHAIFGYIRQLQQLLESLFQLQRIEQIGLPNGQITPAQVTDLHLLSDIFDLLTPEVIMNLTKAGPVAAQHMIIQKYIQTLPLEVRQESAEFLYKFVALQSELAKCESDQGCLSGISEMLDFLHQILDMALSANGNATINIAATGMYMGSTQVMPVAHELFSLLLKPDDAAYVETVQDVLQFVSILLSHPDVTLSNVQEALQQSNLTIEELNELLMWLGAKDIHDLLEKVTQLKNAQECFEQCSRVPELLAHCAVGMVNTISGLLMHLPALQNQQSILSMIPMIVNKTVTDMINTNFTSNPQNAVAETLKATLASVKLSLQLNNMSTPEIQNEMEVFERLINLVGNPEPLKYLNVTPDELYTGVLKLILWYLDPLKNVTSSSSVSHLLEPFYDITRMQVALQLAQMDLTQFITEQVWNLTNSLNHPIDAEGVVKIGQITTAILQHVLKFVGDHLEAQNAPAAIFGYDPPINMTCVKATMMQINNYINLLQLWMSQANFGAWGNLNTSVVEKDIYHLIQSNLHFFNVDQQGYMQAIGNITQALNNVLMSAMQPGGLQSEHFSKALLEAVQSAMDLLIQTNGPLPLSIQESVLTVFQNAVWLAVHPEASYTMSLNATLHILQNLHFLINQIFPQELAQYPVCALEITTTYFESVLTVSGPDGLNQLILNEMKIVESCLPPNSTAQHYISTIIKVTKAILQPSQCNQSLWSLAPSEENIPCMFAEVVKLLNMLCPLFMGESCEPQSFADLPSILEMLMTGQAGNESTGLPLSIEQSVLTVIKNAMWLAAHPEASYEKSVNVTIDMLRSIKFLISQSIPEEYTQYPLLVMDLIITYFKSVASVSGPDGVNQLILNVMKTLESSLPPNIAEQLYISTIVNITKAILQPGLGNQSLLSLNPSEENIPYMIAEVVNVFNMLCPLFMGEPFKPLNASSLGGFADLPRVLELLMTGQASNETWRRLQEFVEALLSFTEPEISHSDLACFVKMFEMSIGDQVNRTKAQTDLILSLQTPVMMLIANLAQSLNNGDYNMSEVSERLEVAIEHTIKKCDETNGTMTCQDVLVLWEPVREAAGLSPSFMAMWCSISLQPVIDGYANDITQYTQQNWTCAEQGPLSAEAAAARMVMTLRSLYHNEMKQSHVTDQFIQALIARFSALVPQPLSPEAQLNLSKQLQQWQIQSSLQSIRLLSKELHKEFPFLKPYMDAVEKMVTHILKNNQLMEGSDDIFNEVAMILLSTINIPSNDTNQIMSGTLSSKAWVDMALKIMKAVIDMKVFGDNPTLYHTLDQILASNDTRMVMHKVAEMVSWLTSTQAKGLDLIVQTLTKVQDLLGSLLSVLTNMADDLPPYLKVFHNLISDAITFIQQLLTSGSIPMANNYNMRQAMLSHNGSKIRNRREVSYMPESPLIPKRSPMDDFIDLLYIDYDTLLISMSKTPTPFEISDMFHGLFGNPNLKTVLKETTKGLDWGLDISKNEMIDAVLEMASLLTIPGMDYSSLVLWEDVVNLLPDDFPYASLLKNITRAITGESPENLRLMQETLGTVSALFQTDWTDPQILEQLKQLRKQVCNLEKTDTLQTVMWGLSLEQGILCNGIVPAVYVFTEGLLNISTLLEDFFEVFVGDPKQYKIQTNWTPMITHVLGIDITNLTTLNFTRVAAVVTIGEMVRNKTAFMLDMEKLGFDLAVVVLLTETALPDSNLVLLSWLVDLRKCGSKDLNKMGPGEKALRDSFCSMNATVWYSFTVLMAQHLNTEKFIYRMVLPTDVQSLVQSMLEMANSMISIMHTMVPLIRKIVDYLPSIENLRLEAINQFRQVSRHQRPAISSGATFVTISRALCSNGILALFGVAKNPHVVMAPPTFDNNPKREEMIERFKIPRNATPFCTNMYLDMVNTTGGAIAWAFLKPMLMGKILFTPNTPQTRAIMNKANSTLQQLADLRHYSGDWIKSSNYIVESSEMLTQTLPLLQNSLGNSFVKNFIEMQTGINVDSMQETLNNFSNMTVLLEKNKDILGQITTLSTLMVDLSSCITFDRHRGYDTEDEINRVAQDLAKNRDLYASVIFKLPKDTDSSRKRRSASSEITLPPKVRYTIRMHMDNVMRTDRARQPFFSKETHISAAMTLRYNRGFIYLQETIDRAIIDIQANKTVTDTAVQIQPFPYPCHHRDEYQEAISFVFPLLLMMAWVLFVADFVKKLVHEREMKLHEYMKMMGVSPFSHFFAWFLESAFYLVLTISILTLVLKCGSILPHSDGFLLFLYLCDYGLSVLAFSFLISTFFDKTYIAALSGSLLYVLAFFPFIAVMALETHISFSVKSLLGLFSPTAFSYASQYISRYETQGEGIHWSNLYSSPIAGDTASFGWLCWLMLIDTFLYFIIGAYIRTVFPGKSGIPSPWYFPFKASFWKDLCGCRKSKSTGRGLFLTNILQTQPPVFPDSDGKGKGKGDLSSKASQNFSDLPVGVALYGLTKVYGRKAAIENLNVAFYEGHVTSLLGHNGAGKTTTMSILTGLFPPSSGTVEVYGRDMQVNLEEIRQELGVCMQYDVLFDHMTAKEHLLLYGQIKAPHWSKRELQEQVRMILEETGMYAHRHKRVGSLSGGMKRKLSISIAFIGGSRLVVLDEPTTGVDPCSRRSIWDIVIQHKKGRTIIMSTHHLDEAEVLSDRIAFLERGGLKCCGTPYHLKDQLGQGYKLTLTKKMHNGESKQIDKADLKAFVQAHVPEARLKEAQGSDLVYLLPPFSSNNASSYRSLLTALDSNLDSLQLGCYGISDTTLEEVFLHLTHGSTSAAGDELPTISETVSDTESINSYPESEEGNEGDTVCFTGAPTVSGVKLAWQQMTAILIKRFHHSRRDWKGLLSQILLPVLFVAFAMGLGVIKSDLRHYPELELSPAIYKIGQSYSFFSNPNSSKLADTMVSFPGLDNGCLQKSNDQVCTRSTGAWTTASDTKKFSTCKCVQGKEGCGARGFVPPHKQIPSSQIVYNVTDLNVENYLVATADDYIRNRYGGYDFGLPLPQNLKMDVKTVPQNRTLSKVWFNPEGHHTMPAYLSSMNNFILRSNLPADKDPSQYAISVSSHPYFGRPDDEDSIVQGMLQIMVALCILAGYSITTASFAIYEVNEHHSGSKRLQHIAGVSEPFYWIVNFFYDMVMYLIPVVLTVGVIAAFQVPAFTDRQNLGAVAMLLVLFGFSTFPWMYLLSSVFKDAEMAFITFVCINLFLSVNTIIPTSILYFMKQMTYQNTEGLTVIFDRLSYAFLIFPQFNFGNGLLALARTNIEVQILSGYGIDAYKDPFSTDALGWMMISSFIQGVVFFTLRLLWNKYIVRKVSRVILRRKSVHVVPNVDGDEDVAAEHLRVSSGAASSDVLQVNQLTKVYQHLNKKVPAVKKLSLGVPAGECFGLLGVNGAGKTTTFKMLTGDVSPTDGTAQIRDRNGRLVDIMECRNQGINIGYCPQEDALDDLLTGEEHLYFYARLHGISKRDIPGVVNYLLRRVELNHYRDTITDRYSCGTRRKLSTALALVGHPQILLLDEPSSGMDPRTKRQLWKIITEEVKGKCAVVLTSHSMEECEALCGRLAIMVKGQFRCLGSLQHIKNRFGSGFTVKMYMAKASSDADAITRFMQSRFPSTYLKEQHSAMVEYHVPIAPGGVADIFGQLESSKEHLEIQHFSVSQTTLDEVFINFAMDTIGMETVPIDDEFGDDSSLNDVEA